MRASWAHIVGNCGFLFSTEEVNGATLQMPGWTKLGPVELKVVRGCTDKGVKYLNFYVKRLGNAGADVGGLLGEDDYADAATPSDGCQQFISLGKRTTLQEDASEALAGFQ
ncbi:unnamed protein product [Prorocentrum cordatum]|uniref:Uncharacterized protein n=1 Tax=Prorocentrum cordatum TaxID=2364126 RepID=A0ABN9QZ92_9DINO|nr:unnamed protein product [Polarella glacialis]